MKNFLAVLISIVLCMSCLSVMSFATDADDITITGISDNTVYYSDGSYTVTSVVKQEIFARSTSTTLTKYTSCFNSDGVETCRLTVRATFIINSGVSATCTSSTYSTQVFVDGWSIASPSATYANYGSYATATASGTAKKKVLGITTKSIALSTTITCYNNGTYA